MKQRQGCGAIAGLEQFYLAHERTKVTTPLGVAVNQEYGATCRAPIIFCQRASQSENSSGWKLLVDQHHEKIVFSLLLP